MYVYKGYRALVSSLQVSTSQAQAQNRTEDSGGGADRVTRSPAESVGRQNCVKCLTVLST